jgi:hypothetical protein
LHTPTPDCFLNGLTRQTVIALARQRGIKVVERAIMPNELGKADEVFLTGSAGRQKGRGQRGVTCSLPNPDNVRFSKRSPGNHGLRFCDGKMGRNSG